jgi:hypothetical protein
MKLFLVSQTKNSNYDTYSDFVICCENEEMARNASPQNGEPLTEKEWKKTYSSWCSSIDQVTVEYLGKAKEGLEKGIICSSYHAG